MCSVFRWNVTIPARGNEPVLCPVWVSAVSGLQRLQLCAFTTVLIGKPCHAAG